MVKVTCRSSPLIVAGACIVMLSFAHAAVPYGIDINSALFTVSINNLDMTGNLLPVNTVASDESATDIERLLHSQASNWLARKPTTATTERFLEFTGYAAPGDSELHQLAGPIDVAVLAEPGTTQAETKVVLPSGAGPEPAPLGFLGLGLIALALARRKNKTRALPDMQTLTLPSRLATAG
jgi:hypothetical protein